MLGRSLDHTNKHYDNYGGRGLALSEQFLTYLGFKQCVLSELGRLPKSHESIDRIDNASGYIPGNLRWANAKIQSRNRRTNVIVELRGERMCLSEAVERFSTLNYNLVWSRVRNLGWELEDALATPRRSK